MSGNFRIALALLLIVLCGVEASQAMPWDRDMYRQQSYQANEMVRNPPADSIPVGRQPFTLTPEEADKVLKNPTPLSADSVWRGRRLYNANCLTCHGAHADGKGPVGPQVAVPDLLTDFYRARSDGRIYAVIQLGGANMPRYGYKFSPDQKWDIINYVRFLQGHDVQGMNRPQE